MKATCKNCNIEFNYKPSTSRGKYCSNKCQGQYSVKKRFIKGTKWRQSMRNFLVENTKYECSMCGVDKWNGLPLTLQVDHIDGDKENNEFNNLRFLCPNCHTQTDTWGVSNMSEEGRNRCRTNIK